MSQKNPPLEEEAILGKKHNLTLEEIVYLTNKIGLQFAKAKKESELLELLKPSKKAEIMEKYEGPKITEAKLRRLSEIDPEYIAYLEKLTEARYVSEQLRIRYESYKNLFEATRSMLSYKKAEMRIL